MDMKCSEGSSPKTGDSRNCSIYWECDNGVYTSRTCAPGTLFDMDSRECHHPQESRCEESCSSTPAQLSKLRKRINQLGNAK